MEGVGPDFTVEYTRPLARARLARLEIAERGLPGLSPDSKKPDLNAPSYLWAVTTRR
jgi:hypothetical protein